MAGLLVAGLSALLIMGAMWHATRAPRKRFDLDAAWYREDEAPVRREKPPMPDRDWTIG